MRNSTAQFVLVCALALHGAADRLPAQSASISSTTNTYSVIDNDNNDTGARFYVLTNGAAGSGSETYLVCVTESGRLGVGDANSQLCAPTAGPLRPFHVQVDQAGSGELMLFENLDAGAGTQAKSAWKNNAGEMFVTGISSSTNSWPSPGGAFLFRGDDKPIHFFVNNKEQFRVVDGGIELKNGADILGNFDDRNIVLYGGASDLSTGFYRSMLKHTTGATLELTNVTCESDTGTGKIQLWRDDGSAAKILSVASLQCGPDGSSSTSFNLGEIVLNSGDDVDVEVVSAPSGTKRINVVLTFKGI